MKNSKKNNRSALDIKKKSPVKEFENDLLDICCKIFGFEKINKSKKLESYGNPEKIGKLIIKINHKFDIVIDQKEIIKKNVTGVDLISEVKRAIFAKRLAFKKQSNRIIPRVKSKFYYTLSSAQKRMWVMYKMEPESSFYNINLVLKLAGKLNISNFRKSLEILFDRHEILRTNFREVQGKAVQIINVKSKFRLKIIDEAEVNEIEKIIKNQTNKPFNLETDVLFRITLVKKGQNKYILVAIIHHIIFDRVSGIIFFKELAQIYNFRIRKEKLKLSKLFIQYKDFAEWEQSKGNKIMLKKQEKFWSYEFKREFPIVKLPFDYPRSSVRTYKSGMEKIILSSNIIKGVKNLLKEKNTTLFIFLLTVFNILIYRITACDDIVIGTSISSRTNIETEESLGIFLNTLPIRIKIDKSFNFDNLLKQVKNKFFNVYKNKDYPFERLIEKINVERKVSKNPLFNIFFEFIKKIDGNDIVNFEGCNIGLYKFVVNPTKFDIRFRAAETVEGTIVITCDYNANIYGRTTIKNYLNIFNELLRNIPINLKSKIDNIRIIPTSEEKAIIKVLTNRKKTVAKNLIIQKRLADSFQKYSEQTAIEYGNKKISYKELDEKSESIANKLPKQKNKKKLHVALLLENKIDLITAILGILKAGHIFVPLETSAPIGKIKVMLEKIDAEYIITDKKKIKNKLFKKFKILSFDLFFSQESKIEKNIYFPKYFPDDEIYIYFSSGSTGDPKAIRGVNKSLVHFIDWEIKELKINKNSRVAQLAPCSFDASLRDFFVPLLTGGTVCVPKDKQQTLVEENLSNWIINNKISLLHTIPSIFKLINPEKSNFTKLKFIILAGEKLYSQDIQNWKNKNVKIINMYGPTETTMLKTYHYVQEKDFSNSYIPIGRPIYDTQIFILDKNYNICPRGVIGELYISTPYKTNGYYDDEELNKLSFIKNPIKKEDKILIYKTGDLAKLHQDGKVEIIGRYDNQVKIRGYRIELGEIEASMRKIDNIKDVVVIKNIENENLVAFYVTKNRKKESDKKINKILQEVLPDYMMPTAFINLKELPLNRNGKLDRIALQKIDSIGAKDKVKEKPKGVVEKKISSIWQDILGVEKINRDDNFFNIGGHSLKAITMSARIKKIFAIDVGLKDIFLHPTIKDLAERIDEKILEINNCSRI
ncbi:MAG: non-ribosomal peptide synthetase [Promethearchaeota archaeon]